MLKHINRVGLSSFQALKTLRSSVIKSIRPKGTTKSIAATNLVAKAQNPSKTHFIEHNQVSIAQIFSSDSKVRKTAAVSLGKRISQSSYRLLLTTGKKGVDKVLSLKPIHDKINQLKGNRNLQDFLLLTDSTYRVVQNAGKATIHRARHFGQPRSKLAPPPPTTFRAGNYARVLQREEGSLWLWVQFSMLALPGSWALYKVTSDENIKTRWREYILTTREQLLKLANH
ncbi:hypothetical protein K7432_008962 [Basidiobolus ranarum]|uniref:Uncharacterized protein n=1 Tax=Basidiobolus ranarum TaxID=34480 RepID=A0ABR2WQZ3_9FUNG